MSQTTYQDPIQSASGKIFGKQSNISQRKLFGIYESTYCYRNKSDHWSDAQTLHRHKMGAASLYAKLLLQDPDFAAQTTAYHLDLNRRAMNSRSAADKQIKPYLRNQQMLTSLLYNRLSTDETFAAPSASPSSDPSDAFPAAFLLEGYTRYRTCRDFDRSAVLVQLAEELSTNLDLSASLKSILLQ